MNSLSSPRVLVGEHEHLELILRNTALFDLIRADPLLSTSSYETFALSGEALQEIPISKDVGCVK